MNLPFTLSTVGGIIAALVLFIILKRVIGLVFRVILAGVLVIAVILGAWWWTSPSGSSQNSNARPQRTRSR
ncbi:MAG: hypothetical protein DMF68_20430 [Acidobacteria bacterium]|nr:MAG: hypothetical protein DMF68_20430 [Acidobacteriota bacterium]